MTDLQKDLDEYRQIKGWLAGEQPPATGRTWRRKVHDAVALALPAPVMSKVDRAVTMVPAVSGIKLMCFGVASMFSAAICPFILQALSFPDIFQALSFPENPMFSTSSPFITFLSTIFASGGAVIVSLGILFFLVNGE